MSDADGKQGLDDAILVVAACLGSADSFAELVDRYRAPMVTVAQMITRSREAAEDIAQDALMAAHRSLGQLREPQRFGSWLYAITRRRALRHVEEHRRMPAASPLETRDGRPGEQPAAADPAVGYERAETARELREAVARLVAAVRRQTGARAPARRRKEQGMTTLDEVRGIIGLLRSIADIAETSSLTGSLKGGAKVSVRSYNVALKRLQTLEAVPQDFFAPLDEASSMDEIGVASAHLAAYLKKMHVEPHDRGGTPVEEVLREILGGTRTRFQGGGGPAPAAGQPVGQDPKL